MSKLTIPGYIGVISVIYTILVVVIQCKKYYDHYKHDIYIEDDEDTHANYIHIEKGFTSKLKFFQCCSTLFAAYSCHTGVYPVYQGFTMQEDGKKKMKLTTLLSCILVAILHVLSATCSFLIGKNNLFIISFLDPITPEDLILYRRPYNEGYDVAMNIGKIAVALGLFFSAPAMYFSFRLTLINMFFDGKITTMNNLIITTVTSLLSALIACVYDKILNYLNYIGGFVSVIFCYLYPPIMYAKVNKKGWTHWQNVLEIALGVFIACVGVTAGILTIIQDIQGDD